jgi:hypothetical protein
MMIGGNFKHLFQHNAGSKFIEYCYGGLEGVRFVSRPTVVLF